MTGGYRIVRKVYNSRLKRLWHYLQKCSIDKCFLDQNTRSIGAILRAWHAYGGSCRSTKVFPRLFVKIFLYVSGLIILFVVPSASALEVTSSLLTSSSHMLRTKYSSGFSGETCNYCSIGRMRVASLTAFSSSSSVSSHCSASEAHCFTPGGRARSNSSLDNRRRHRAGFPVAMTRFKFRVRAKWSVGKVKHLPSK